MLSCMLEHYKNLNWQLHTVYVCSLIVLIVIHVKPEGFEAFDGEETSGSKSYGFFCSCGSFCSSCKPGLCFNKWYVDGVQPLPFIKQFHMFLVILFCNCPCSNHGSCIFTGIALFVLQGLSPQSLLC